MNVNPEWLNRSEARRPVLEDTVFALRNRETPTMTVWRVCVNGRVLPTTWPDKGSALAGLATEQLRATKRVAEATPPATARSAA